MIEMIEDEKRMFAGVRLTRKEEEDRCARIEQSNIF